jgi:hypothetical protein
MTAISFARVDNQRDDKNAESMAEVQIFGTLSKCLLDLVNGYG